MVIQLTLCTDFVPVPYSILFWSEINFFISSVMVFPNIMYPKNCLLGVFGDISMSVTYTVFLCKKRNQTSWKGTSAPILNSWLELINKTFPLYKLTFELRKKLKLFHKLWGTGDLSGCRILGHVYIAVYE